MTVEDKYLSELRRLIDAAPQLAPVVLESARHLKRLANDYKRAHWGLDGNDPTVRGVVVDPSQGVVDLGALVSVSYMTEKGRDGKSIYVHDFKGPFPRLAFGQDETGKHGLVVVRTTSRYDVTERGIVG